MSTELGDRLAALETDVSILKDEHATKATDPVAPLRSDLAEYIEIIGGRLTEMIIAVGRGKFSGEELVHQLADLNSNFQNGFDSLIRATGRSANAEGASHQVFGGLIEHTQELGGLIEQRKEHNTNYSPTTARIEASNDTEDLHERRAVEQSNQLIASRLPAVDDELKAMREEIDRLEAQLARAESSGGSEDAAYWKKAAEQLATSLTTQQHLMQELDAKHNDTHRLLMSRLHAAVQELAAAKGAIRVICRIKPEPSSEGDKISFTNPDSGGQSFLPWTKLRATYLNDSRKSESRDYQFQRVFGSGETNQAIFEEVQDVARSAAFGQACTIMAYGATGTGKSHTFLSDDGLVQSYIRLLFALAEEEQGLCEYEFHLSTVEIYMNKIYDLLQAPTGKQKVEVRLSGESSIKLDSEGEAIDIVAKTIHQREAASTKQNATSSRSHFIISITIDRKTLGDSGEKPTQGFIKFIDLAGSEAAGKNFMASGSDPRRKLIYEQGQDINKGLLDLGQGVRNLATKGKFFPGHNLTRALRLSLVPGSRLLMVVTVSPLTANQTNSLNTLRWSQEAIGITGEAPGAKTITTRGKAPGAATPPRGRLSVPSASSARHSTPAKSTAPNLGSRRR